MKAKLTFEKEEIAAMIEANVANMYLAPPGYKWAAEWRQYDNEVTVEAVKIEDKQEVQA